eukprot:TRINITY_DN26933_c0_g1_i1.p1 TRINITY_DN26933_c0_g1~~TRINITY_DN26933_c0_g1_i1.p1  ORF type:complete len:266 (-),score=43.91 TRINITY_DN26933_c0_g1_i1:269-949(-)
MAGRANLTLSGINKAYWDAFYKKGEVPQECSTFAESVLAKVSKTDPLLELGCGNGRDAFYFAKHGIPVWATDLSDVSILDLNNKVDESKNPHFFAADFTKLPTPYENTQFGTVYSRFTLHAVKAEEASRALSWSWRNLKEGGALLIEVRSVLDPLCGQGEPVEGERDAWMTTHYRRFVRKDELVAELTALGFEIEFLLEQNNLTIYQNDNPVLIRVHARKPAAKSQ